TLKRDGWASPVTSPRSRTLPLRPLGLRATRRSTTSATCANGWRSAPPARTSMRFCWSATRRWRVGRIAPRSPSACGSAAARASRAGATPSRHACAMRSRSGAISACDRSWWIVNANITLALHHNAGEALDDSSVKAIALHEVGHLLGLDHTSDTTDIMTARVRVRDLSNADRATMKLLYSLPPGSVCQGK